MRIVHTASAAGKVEVGVNTGDVVIVIPLQSVSQATKRRDLKTQQAILNAKITGKPVKLPSEKNLSLGYGKAEVSLPDPLLTNSDRAVGGRTVTIQVQAFSPLTVAESLESKEEEFTV